MQFLVIAGANTVMRCPPGCPNCTDVMLRTEEIDGITYRSLELELDADERKAVAEGGTLIIRQMGESWVPVAAYFQNAAGEPVSVG